MSYIRILSVMCRLFKNMNELLFFDSVEFYQVWF